MFYNEKNATKVIFLMTQPFFKLFEIEIHLLESLFLAERKFLSKAQELEWYPVMSLGHLRDIVI